VDVSFVVAVVAAAHAPLELRTLGMSQQKQSALAGSAGCEKVVLEVLAVRL
jgi:hypothetical protein